MSEDTTLPLDHTFNPNEHLIQIKNKGVAQDYLPVQWRLVWFREQCPQGTIDTEEKEVDANREVEVEGFAFNANTRKNEKVMKRARGYARFKAIVTDGKGGRATGTKSENAANFPDYIEKAETGAIGRALAALGYGTQFAPELDEEDRLVDSPTMGKETQSQSTQAQVTITAKAAVQPAQVAAQTTTAPAPQQASPVVQQAPAQKQQAAKPTVEQIQKELATLLAPYRTEPDKDKKTKHSPATHMLNALRTERGLPATMSDWTLAHYQKALVITKEWLQPASPEQRSRVEEYERFMGITFVQALSCRLCRRIPSDLAKGPLDVLIHELDKCLLTFELAGQVDIGPNGASWVHLLASFKEQSILNLIHVDEKGRVDNSQFLTYQRYIIDQYRKGHIQLSDEFTNRWGEHLQRLLATA